MPNPHVLLVRHASRARKWDQPESAHEMELWEDDYSVAAADSKKPGLPVTRGLAGQLCDQLEIENLKVSRIYHSHHEVATQTAKVFARVLGMRGRLDIEAPGTDADYDSRRYCCWGLTPDDVKTPNEAKKTAEEKDKHIIDCIISKSLTYMVIGHQPQLTRLARALLDKRSPDSTWFTRVYLRLKKWIFFEHSLPANVLPLGSSEVACIQLSEDRRLLWLMTEKSPELLVELKAKIQSKYEVAKFFLGALVVGTGLTLSDAVWNLSVRDARVMAGLGAFAALVSLSLTAATLFSYDRLLMPQDFWSGTDKVEEKPSRFLRWFRRLRGRDANWTVSRPPSQIHVILFYEMVHVWTHLFIPAIVTAFMAVGMIITARAHNSVIGLPSYPWTAWLRWHPLFTFFWLMVAALLIGRLAFGRSKPRLGFDD